MFLTYQIPKVFCVIAFLLFSPHSACAEILPAIKSNEKFKIAIKDNVRPLGFRDTDGKLAGLEIDIAHKLAEEILGDQSAVELLPVNNQNRLRVVLEDKVDLAIARVGVTAPRSRVVDFSRHYYLDGTGIVTKNLAIKNLNSLTKSTIVVLKNSATIAVIRYKLPHATLIGVSSYNQALQLIETQQADAFASDRSILTGWIQEYPDYKLLPERLSGSALAIVMPKGLQYKELRSKINQAIAGWQKSGWLAERIKFWEL